MAFSLSRNAKLYVSTSQTIAAMTNANTWEVPVLDGFSFTAATATQEIEISEAGAAPTRGQQVFTTAIEPVDWSLQAYMRPRFNTLNTQVDAVERILWEALASAPTSTIGTNADGGAGGASTRNEGSAGGLAIDFDNSNVNELLQLSMLFNLGTNAAPVWYHITGAVVDTAEVDFAIDAIASISWGGFGTRVLEVQDTADLATLTTLLANANGDWLDTAFPDGTPGYLAAPTGVQACIRNKLSTVTLVGKSGTAYANTYDIALTGGTLSIANNITFLTPEALGVVNNPCGHFTGQRVVSGNMTAYLKTGGTNDTADLMNDVITHSNTPGVGADPTDFELTINVGGGTPGSPYNTPIVQFLMAGTHLVIPTINIEDVVSLDIPFNALPYSGATPDANATNELVVTYYANET
jgi:hypothetical protein